MLPAGRPAAERWPISASADRASRALRMHSSQFWRWFVPTGADVEVACRPAAASRIAPGVISMPVAIDVDRALGPLERAAAGAAVEHLDAVGVDELAGRSRRCLGRLNLDRAGCVHVQGPLGDVEVVAPHVGQHAAGVFAVVAARPGSGCGRPRGRAPRCSRASAPGRATGPSRCRRASAARAGRTAWPGRRRRCAPSSPCRSGRCGRTRPPCGTGRRTRSAAGCRSGRRPCSCGPPRRSPAPRRSVSVSGFSQ